jgi:hypothetical protein
LTTLVSQKITRKAFAPDCPASVPAMRCKSPGEPPHSK